MEKPLVNQNYLVQKFSGKGGWTFVEIPEIPQATKVPFGWVRVYGSIDDYEFKQYKLMPMGNGKLFLPLKASVRKKIGKSAGDTVHVILYADNSSLIIPDELMVCLLDAPTAHQFFQSLTESNQKYYIDWIGEAKRLETKVERIAKTIERLENGLKLHDSLKNGDTM
jgi:hypothetical protein